MLKRIITSIVALAVFIPVLVFSDTWVFPIVMGIASSIGCCEMICCVGQKKNFWLFVPISACAVTFPILTRGALVAQKGFSEVLTFSVGLFLILAIYVFGVTVFKNKTLPVTNAGLTYASCAYTIAAFTSIVYIHDFIPFGKYLYLLVFVCAWVTDSFAYFTGRFLGKHKLIPAVSPKKTVEGAIGGVLFCVIAMLVFGFVIVKFFNPTGALTANYLVLGVSGVFISVVSQIGDLVMSVIKRKYGIKDYGWIFPGHGGILDRFDSVLAVSLMLAFICTYFELLPVVIS